MILIPAGHLKPSQWSGGTTTELCIFPPTSAYKDLNFDFRISRATIDVETSTFTPLLGIQRTLMVLRGHLELNHKHHHTSSLDPFDSDHFAGDWQTHCSGKAEDFNLMIRTPEATGSVEHFLLEEKMTLLLATRKHGFLHVYRGAVEVTVKTQDKANEHWSLGSGDSIYFEESEAVKIMSRSRSDVIFVRIETNTK